MILLAALLAALILLAAGLGWGITALYYRARLAVAEDAVETSRDLVTEALGQLHEVVDDSLEREERALYGLSGADEVKLAALAADLTDDRRVGRALRRFTRRADRAGNPET